MSRPHVGVGVDPAAAASRVPRSRHPALFSALVVITALIGLLFPQAVAAVTPSLAGELLLESSGGFQNVTCDEAGVSTLHYSTSGNATGPYSGTFTESFDLTVGPQTTTFGGLYGGLTFL
jgi:hypothetical protein